MKTYLQTATGEDRTLALLDHEVGMYKPSVFEAFFHRRTFPIIDQQNRYSFSVSRRETLILRWRTLEDQHQEPGGLLGDLLEEIFKPVAHEGNVGTGFGFISSSERTRCRQEQVRQTANVPDVGLWIGGLAVQHFRSWKKRKHLGNSKSLLPLEITYK